MMNFLGNFVWVTMALTVAIIFLCVSLIGLAVLDYLLDSDIKGALNRELGPRPLLKRLKDNLLELGKKLDEPTWKERAYQDPDFDKKVHDVINDIWKEKDDACRKGDEDLRD